MPVGRGSEVKTLRPSRGGQALSPNPRAEIRGRLAQRFKASKASQGLGFRDPQTAFRSCCFQARCATAGSCCGATPTGGHHDKASSEGKIPFIKSQQKSIAKITRTNVALAAARRRDVMRVIRRHPDRREAATLKSGGSRSFLGSLRLQTCT